MMRSLRLSDWQAYLLGRSYLARDIYQIGLPKRFLSEPTLHDAAGARIDSASQILAVGSAGFYV